MLPSRSIIITGGNAGLGFETAKEIARDRSGMVVVACRNRALGEDVVERLRAMGGLATFIPLDLGIQPSVRRFVELFREAGLPPLAAILCNAGTQNVAAPQTTAEGYETTFAVNHLGHYLLVRLLLGDLTADGRITFVASGTHDPRQKTGLPAPVYKDAITLARDLEAGRQAGLRRYATSKLCNVLCTYELSRRLKASGDLRLASIKVNAIDPGLMLKTGLGRSWPKPLQWVSYNILPLLLRFVVRNVHTPEVSGARVAALSGGAEAAPGARYFSNGEAVRSSDLSYDEALQHELWVSSANMTGLPVGLGGLRGERALARVGEPSGRVA